MPDELARIYWDACCFTYYINGDPDRLPNLSAVMDDVAASNQKKQIVTSVISRIEVAFSLEEAVKHQLTEDEEARIAALWADVTVVAQVDVHELIVERARKLIRDALSKHLALRAADAIHLASAIQVQAPIFHTYDRKLFNKHYRESTGLDICEPQPDQPKMF